MYIQLQVTWIYWQIVSRTTKHALFDKLWQSTLIHIIIWPQVLALPQKNQIHIAPKAFSNYCPAENPLPTCPCGLLPQANSRPSFSNAKQCAWLKNWARQRQPTDWEAPYELEWWWDCYHVTRFNKNKCHVFWGSYLLPLWVSASLVFLCSVRRALLFVDRVSMREEAIECNRYISPKALRQKNYQL